MGILWENNLCVGLVVEKVGWGPAQNTYSGIERE